MLATVLLEGQKKTSLVSIDSDRVLRCLCVAKEIKKAIRCITEDSSCFGSTLMISSVQAGTRCIFMQIATSDVGTWSLGSSRDRVSEDPLLCSTVPKAKGGHAFGARQAALGCNHAHPITDGLANHRSDMLFGNQDAGDGKGGKGRSIEDRGWYSGSMWRSKLQSILEKREGYERDMRKALDSIDATFGKQVAKVQAKADPKSQRQPSGSKDS